MSQLVLTLPTHSTGLPPGTTRSMELLAKLLEMIAGVPRSSTKLPPPVMVPYLINGYWPGVLKAAGGSKMVLDPITVRLLAVMGALEVDNAVRRARLTNAPLAEPTIRLVMGTVVYPF